MQSALEYNLLAVFATAVASVAASSAVAVSSFAVLFFAAVSESRNGVMGKEKIIVPQTISKQYNLGTWKHKRPEYLQIIQTAVYGLQQLHEATIQNICGFKIIRHIFQEF